MRPTPSDRLLRSGLLLLTAAACLAACSTPVRRHDLTEVPIANAGDSSGPKAKEALGPAPETPEAPRVRVAKDGLLPAATMDPRQLRAALRDIAARQRRGEGAKALDDYNDRAKQTGTLEARFLAASAIANDDDSWEALKKIQEEQTKFFWTHARIAEIYSHWKVRDQCEKEINAAIDAAPDISLAYTIRGDLYRHLGEYQLSQRDYATAIRMDPGDGDARAGLALTKRAMGQTETFRADLEQALKDVPTQYEAAETLALLLDDANDVDGARQAWERVATLSPKNRGAQLALARLRGDADPAGAIAAYEKAAKAAPLTKVEQESLAKLYRQQGKTDDEVKALQVISKLDPKDPTPQRRIAEIAEKKGDTQAAETAFHAIMTIDAKDIPAQLGLARVLEKRARIREAMEWLHQAKEAGSAEAKTAFARLSEVCMVPAKPLTANNLANYYRAVSGALEKLYEKRLVDAPQMKGALKVRIETDGDGHILKAEVVDNNLNDPWLEAHLFFAVLQSNIPKLKASEPKKFSLKFDLPPLKQ